MHSILVIAVVWLTALVCFVAILRSAALADRAAERQRGGGRAAPMLATIPHAAATAPDASAAGFASASRAPGPAGPQAGFASSTPSGTPAASRR